jgi:hypothetical protein
MPYFDRFNLSWAASGSIIEPTPAQADVGFAYLGPVPPSVEGFNAMFQWNDDKDNWLFNQISNVILDAGGIVSESDLDALLDAINSKIQAVNPSGVYLPLVGGTLAGPGNLVVQGLLNVTGSKIVAEGAQPSVTLHVPASTFAGGFWATNGILNFGSMDGAGNVIGNWGTITGADFSHIGNVRAGANVFATGGVYVGTTGNFALVDSGNRHLYWDVAGGYVDYWEIANGNRVWAAPGGNMIMDWQGLVTHSNRIRVASTGINYYAVDAGNYHAWGWDGTNINAYVNGTYLGAVTLSGAIGNFVYRTGDTMTGNLTVPGVWSTSGDYMSGGTVYGALQLYTPGSVVAVANVSGAGIFGSVVVESPTVQTTNAAAYLSGGNVYGSAVVSSGGNVTAGWDVTVGNHVLANGYVYAGRALVPDLEMHADSAATYLKFNTTRYYNYERATGNLVYWGNSGRAHIWQDGGTLDMMSDMAWKVSTNTWYVSSDERMKNIKSNYSKGLAEIIAMQPIVYTVRNDFEGFVYPRLEGISDDVENPPEYNTSQRIIESQEEAIGLSAQLIEVIMPEMIAYRKAKINGQVVDDFRGLNTHALTFAFINAFKEVNARLLALEGSA